ncbi:MAG: hypothetical protein HOC71_11100 [Candidatus Latescibacteria bacterium]|nr:hypothetical protein [Candidatus Latescibacterota bacterium]
MAINNKMLLFEKGNIMKKLYCIAIITFCIKIFLLNTLSFGEEKPNRIFLTPELEEIYEIASLGDMMITSAKGYVTWEKIFIDNQRDIFYKFYPDFNKHPTKMLNLNDAVGTKIEGLFALDGIKRRCDIYELNTVFYQPENELYLKIADYKSESIYKSVYNGEAIYQMVTRRKTNRGKNEINPSGFIRSVNDKTMFESNNLNLLHNLGDINSLKIASIFQDDRFSKFEIIGEEKKETYICKILQAEISDTDSTITLWLARELLYRPVFIEIKDSEWLTTENISYRKYSTDIWFPDSKVTKLFSLQNNSGKKALFRILKLNINKGYEINCTFPENYFELQFPCGIQVEDLRTGERYTTEEGDKFDIVEWYDFLRKPY